MFITSDQIADFFRRDVNDPLEGPDDAPDADSLWSEADVYRYMTFAVEKVAEDVAGYFRTRTYDVAAGQSELRLPWRVLDVRRAHLESSNRSLREVNINDLVATRDYGPRTPMATSWETVTGQPDRFCLNYQPNVLRLFPIPTQADRLTLTATFLPLPQSPGAPFPFDETADQQLVLLWMKHLAYAKHDADSFNEAMSDKFGSQYASSVRDRHSQLLRRRRAPGNVRVNW